MTISQIQSGFILINKQTGISSHTVVNRLRRITSIRKIGHAGTLDPLASGLMILAIGRDATRKIDQYVKLDKEYIATLHLGAETDTYDREGEVINVDPNFSDRKIDEKIIQEILNKFLGEQDQIPPMFSAKKVNGQKLYDLARKGIEIERKPSRINIYNIEFIIYSSPLLKIKIKCSSGTYIRSIAFDFGRALGCGAYLEALERTEIGEFKIEKSFKLEELDSGNWAEKVLRVVS
ncbi:MAG: tRNA pseudouridine(55) synthase TruB [Candidatus Magasanikbacteria bacterium]|nr:tRNA pseudouridine(55) synthase TruB [Candidatus Magasanikbacteria bacterium]